MPTIPTTLRRHPRPLKRRRRPAVEWLESRLAPAIFTVTTSSGADVPGSLIDCVRQANAFPGADVVLFDAAAFGSCASQNVIRLVAALPVVTDELTIQGPEGPQLILERANEAPEFRLIESVPGVPLTLRDLTLRNGTADIGGAVLSRGSLLLETCRVEGNTATQAGGAVAGYDSVTAINCYFRNNVATDEDSVGGALYISGPGLRLDRVTFAENRADFGSALTIETTTFAEFAGLLTNCTFADNESTTLGDGGTIVTRANAGGLKLELVHCTLAHNRAFGYYSAGILTFGRAGASSLIAYQNTLFADNRGPNVVNTAEEGFEGTVLSLGHNLSDDDSGIFTGPGDLIDANPQVGILADNGGGVPTVALLPGSPALGAAAPRGETPIDARGIGRPANPDIGAFEARTFTFEVADGDRQQARREAVFTDPLLVRLFEGGQLVSGAPVSFRSPTGGVIFSYPIVYTVDGVASSGTFSAGSTPGVVPVTATVGGDTRTFSLTIGGNSAPVLSAGGNTFVNAATPFRRTVGLTDTDGDALTLRVSYGDGTPAQTIEAGNRVDLSHVYLAEGTYTVRVQAFDGLDYSPQQTFLVHVLIPGVPTTPAQEKPVLPGQTASVSVAGAMFRYTASPLHFGPVVIIVAGVPVTVANLLDGAFFTDGRTIILAAYDLRAVNAGPADSAVAFLQYPAAETRQLIVSFFDRLTSQQVEIPPPGYGVNRSAGVVSIPLSAATLPRLQDLGGTVFTIAVPVLEPAPSSSSDLVQASMQLDRRNGPALALTLRETTRVAAALAGTAFIVSKADLKSLSGVFRASVSTSEEDARARSEAGPLAELPTVPPVLNNLPSLTLTPAGSEPAVTPPASSKEASGSVPPVEEASGDGSSAAPEQAVAGPG